MKRNFAPLVVLRRLRPGRRAVILLVYLLVVSSLIAVLAWRGLSPDRLPLPPLTGEKEPPLAVEAPVRPPVPFNALDEEYVTEPLPAETEPAVPTAVARGNLRWPLEGEIIVGHHEVYRINNQLRLHVGVDIAAKPDALVMAAWPGVVADVREDARLGLVMEIDHGDGYISVYGNLADVFFAVDEEVKSGEVVARAGNTARLDAAEGNFLHFALYKNGLALDPVRETGGR
jgi:murein DD-endopeptidase MepM/ murein hydrolase activator NlpD